MAHPMAAINHTMSESLLKPNQQSLWGALGALLASSGALVCCVLPAVMVSLGAGAGLVTLLGFFPQLIWLSQHKGLVFGFATAMLIFAGLLLHRARRAPCPADLRLAMACQRLRRWSVGLYGFAVIATVVSALFAFVLPKLMA